ncbi:MAG: hypothetical protein WD041_04330 [Nitriliruptoraceae bacterium]
MSQVRPQVTLAGRLQRIVKAYDIRGVVDTELDTDVAHALGWAAAIVLDTRQGMVVGRDMRPSSPELCAAYVDGVRRAGVDVVDVGLAATDQLYHASGILDLPGAMFTASHNPAEYNGIKLCGRGAAPVSADTGLTRIRDLAVEAPRGGPITGGLRHEDMLERYAAHVRSFVDATVFEGLDVAVDAGNGMAGHTWPAVAEPLGIRTDPLYFELDGTFPNHPANPLDDANLRDLRARVVECEHPVGLAFDGDADRVFVVDEHGRPVSASLVGAVVAGRMLRDDPGATVLVNLICSRTVTEAIEAAGGVVVRTRVGHSFIKQRMAETGALLAIEHSGHYYFRDHHRADSGAIAALLVLEVLVRTGGTLSELVAPFDRYVATGERNHVVEDPSRVLDAVGAAFADRGTVDHDDGLTVDLGAAWFNLRPSNTEALLRLNVEASDAPGLAALTDEVTAMIESSGTDGND